MVVKDIKNDCELIKKDEPAVSLANLPSQIESSLTIRIRIPNFG